jgi:hypothetical protein
LVFALLLFSNLISLITSPTKLKVVKKPPTKQKSLQSFFHLYSQISINMASFAPPTEFAAADTNGEAAAPAAAAVAGEQKPQRERRQHTPPEELYDLTKPIPKVRFLTMHFICECYILHDVIPLCSTLSYDAVFSLNTA